MVIVFDPQNPPNQPLAPDPFDPVGNRIQPQLDGQERPVVAIPQKALAGFELIDIQRLDDAIPADALPKVIETAIPIPGFGQIVFDQIREQLPQFGRPHLLQSADGHHLGCHRHATFGLIGASTSGSHAPLYPHQSQNSLTTFAPFTSVMTYSARFPHWHSMLLRFQTFLPSMMYAIFTSPIRSMMFHKFDSWREIPNRFDMYKCLHNYMQNILLLC